MIAWVDPHPGLILVNVILKFMVGKKFTKSEDMVIIFLLLSNRMAIILPFNDFTSIF